MDAVTTRADWPRAKGFGLRHMPTITGKRTPSRRARKTWLKQQARERASVVWRAATRYAMAEHGRIMSLGPLAGLPENEFPED